MGILISVFVQYYTDASPTEIGMLLMLMPFTGIIFRPMICSMADREQAHKKYLIRCLLVVIIGYAPYIIIPLIGPSFYEVHPRLSFYIMVVMKVIGDVAFGGVISIGDSLAINYAKRIGTDFNVYRVWGTISWMVFGFIIGQVNEIWFLPKYVAGFIILVACSAINMFIIWLWPDEYFKMVSMNSSNESNGKQDDNQGDGGEMSKLHRLKSVMTKSLMPSEVVLPHMKRKMRSLLTCSCSQVEEPKLDDINKNGESKRNKHNLPDIVVVQPKNDKPAVEAATTTTKESTLQPEPKKKINYAYRTGSVRSMSSFDWTNSAKLSADIDVVIQTREDNINKTQRISKRVQFKILLLLIRRDLRIIPYLLFFVCGGSTVIPLSFVMMNLSDICHKENRCAFSELAGLLQVSMAAGETIYLLFSSRILIRFGRIKTSAAVFMLVFVKYLFYATFWESVDPYYAIVAELPSGIIFATWLILSVELGHLFSNEVEYIMPELEQKGLIKDQSQSDSLKLSLAATMQAVIASFNDGCGRGLGALIYGIIVDKYSYKTLWMCISVFALSVALILWAVALLDYLFDFRLGLDVQAADKRERANEQQQLAQVQEKRHTAAVAANDNQSMDRMSLSSKK